MKKVVNGLYKASSIFEVIMGIFVCVAIVINGTTVAQDLGHFWLHRMEEGSFSIFLEQVLNLIIGIEFLKMLLKPNTETILEVLIFVIARHMVVGSTSSVDDLLSVISVGLLLMVKKYFGNQKMEYVASEEIQVKEPEKNVKM